MNKINISFIIPMYNCSCSITKCLNAILSICNSDYTYEIVIVDDGSTDDSCQNAISLLDGNEVTKHSYSIIKISHGGPGYARNVGLENAIGDFVWFVDADDEIIPDSINQLLKQAYDSTLEILGFNICLVYPDGTSERYSRYTIPDVTYYNGKEFVKRHWDYLGTPWSYIFHRKFLIDNGIRFPMEILHEDEVFSIKAFYACEKMGISLCSCYKYYIGNGHIMSTASSKRVHSLIQVCDVLYSLYRNTDIGDSFSVEVELLKRIVLMLQQLIYVYFNCKESLIIDALEKRIIETVYHELSSGKHQYELRDFYGKNLDHILTKLKQYIIQC